jgi:hypothetical protein
MDLNPAETAVVVLGAIAFILLCIGVLSDNSRNGWDA